VLEDEDRERDVELALVAGGVVLQGKAPDRSQPPPMLSTASPARVDLATQRSNPGTAARGGGVIVTYVSITCPVLRPEACSGSCVAAIVLPSPACLPQRRPREWDQNSL